MTNQTPLVTLFTRLNERMGAMDLEVGISDDERSAVVRDVKRLVDGGFDLNRSHHGSVWINRSNLLAACAAIGSLEAMELLIQAGANIDGTGRPPTTRRPECWLTTQHTPLMMAALFGQTPAVERLLDAGANIEAMDEHGATPVLYAATGPSPSVISLLVERGACVLKRNTSGDGIMDIWLARDFPDIDEPWRQMGEVIVCAGAARGERMMGEEQGKTLVNMGEQTLAADLARLQDHLLERMSLESNTAPALYSATPKRRL